MGLFSLFSFPLLTVIPVQLHGPDEAKQVQCHLFYTEHVAQQIILKPRRTIEWNPDGAS